MTKRDLERIAFVTRQFLWMRNAFVIACVGPMFFIAVAAKDAPPWVYIAWMSASILIFALAERWATRRFGRVVPDERPGALRRLPRILLPAIVGQLWQFDNESLAPGLPSVALVFAGVVVLWLAIRDWPFRSYRFVIPPIAFAGAIARMAVTTKADRDLWYLVAGGGVVLAFMAVGILDYLTLARVFGPARSPERIDADAL